MYCALIVAPVTENVNAKFNAPKVFADPVPVVSTLTAAALLNGTTKELFAVAKTPWLIKVPTVHTVDVVAVGEIVRNVISPSRRHGALVNAVDGTVWAGDAPIDVPAVVKPMTGSTIKVPVAGVVNKPPITNR